MKKRYNITKQETPYFCVPSIIQAILREYAQEISQREIASYLNPSEYGFMPDEKLKRFLKIKGFNYQHYYYNEIPLNEPELLIEQNLSSSDIIICYEKKGRHAELIVEFKEPRIVLLCPQHCQEHEENFYKILRKMHEDKIGEFGLVSRL